MQISNHFLQGLSRSVVQRYAWATPQTKHKERCDGPAGKTVSDPQAPSVEPDLCGPELVFRCRVSQESTSLTQVPQTKEQGNAPMLLAPVSGMAIVANSMEQGCWVLWALISPPKPMSVGMVHGRLHVLDITYSECSRMSDHKSAQTGKRGNRGKRGEMGGGDRGKWGKTRGKRGGKGEDRGWG